MGEAVRAVQASIDALPTADTVTAADYDTVQAAYDAYEALTDEQQALIVGAAVFEELYAWFNGQLQTIDEEYVVCVFDGNTQIQEMLI